jgi:putative peptidoglycan lipid II flippase
MVPASLMLQVLSFASSIVLATVLGASTQTDAYYLALSVPLVAYAVLLAAIRLGGVPVLTDVSHACSPDELATASSELVSGTLVAASLLTAVITAVMLLVLPAAAGAGPKLSELMRWFMLELSPYAVTGALVGVLGAILAVRGHFVAPMLVLGLEPIAKSVLLLLFSHQLGAQALVIGNVSGNMIAVAVLWWLTVRGGPRLSLVRFRHSTVVRRVFKLSLPLVISQAVLQLNPLIDRTTAAPLGRGSVTVFELGSRVFAAPTTLIGVVLITPLVASWSARFAEEGWPTVVASFGRGVRAILAMVPPAIAVGFLLRTNLVKIAYGSHRYGPSAVSRTADVLGALLFGMPAQLLIVALSTMFVVRGNTIVPMIIGIANCIINAAFDLALRGPLGVAGIALSTSVTLTILCVAYAEEARRRWGMFDLKGLGRPALASGISCLVICLAVVLLVHPGGAPATRLGDGLFVAAILAGAFALHAGVLVVARVWRLDSLIETVKTRLNGHPGLT